MVAKENVQRNVELAICYVNGQPAAAIAQVYGVSKTTVENAVTKLFARLWVNIRNAKLPHPYGEQYKHAYHNGVEFRPRNLVKNDLMAHKDFWVEQIKKYKAQSH